MSTDPDPFSAFRAAVDQHFVPLAVDFALGPAVERILSSEIYIQFSAVTRWLTIAFEYSSEPWVEIGISTPGREHRFGLHTLEQDVEGTCNLVSRVSTLPTIGEQVHVLADLTRRYAATLLQGDMSRLRALQLLRARAHRERNLELTGTRSGAEPLDHRPTLSELFASAQGAEFSADVRLFCAYRAVWDHDYTVDQVAGLLGVQPADIQRILDALDNVSDEPPNLDALRRIVAVGK